MTLAVLLLREKGQVDKTCEGEKMERSFSEGKRYQPQSSRPCSIHNKALQTQDSGSIPITYTPIT